MTNSPDSNVEFIGYFSSKIRYSAEYKRWEIVNTFSGEILAYMNGTSKIPFGFNHWYFPQSNCISEGKKFRTLNFHKYVEQPGYYCCHDGTCFTSDFVCDGARHCDSGEDELNCQLIQLPNTYDKMVPPSTLSIDFNIEKILGINDHDSTFDVYFSIKITWFDKKVKFNYLKTNNHVNNVPNAARNEIWIPTVQLAFIRGSFNNFGEKVYIEKRSSPSMSANLSNLNVFEVYDGNTNPFVLFSEHDMRFFCDFNGVAKYPFGSETCSFDFYLKGPANELTNIKHTLKYPTQKLIGQYEIMGWKIENQQKESKNVITISISLDKRQISILMMTYLPALLMNIINQATNYITGDSAYDLIITVNITSMVVLASIYMSVSMSLPNTPDIKPVEVWLVFSIAYPFLVIITNVVMQVSIS